MKFKITNNQIILILLGSIIGTVIGYFQAPLIYCIKAPCNQPYLLSYSVYGFLIGGLLIMAILIYNNFRRI